MERKKYSYIYLHGFASGPQSKKACFFNDKLTACGITAAIPDMNTPSFTEMTLTSQIEHVGSKLIKDDCVVIGSSMGGLVATLSATRFPSVRALILLAPGFGIEKRWGDLVDADKRSIWKQQGVLDVFHYATQKNEALSYRFVEDLESYSTRNIQVSIPTLILHGIHDDVVPVSESKNFAAQNQNHAKLIELDDGHELIESLPAIWNASENFLKEHELFA
jgi:pimeloyl-ACP methyl ester carboxylesterase